MQSRAIARYVRVTPRKVNQVLDLVRGVNVEAALTTLGFSKKHVAKRIEKTVRSAVANAIQADSKLDVEDLYIKEALVGPGPIMKRWLPRAQGRATPILKRSSHITIVLEAKASKKKATGTKTRPAVKAGGPGVKTTKASTATAKPTKSEKAARPAPTKAPAKRMKRATKRGG